MRKEELRCLRNKEIGNVGTIFVFLDKEQVLWTMTTEARYLSFIKYFLNEYEMLFYYLLWERC